MRDRQFGLFCERDGLLVWRGFFTDLNTVKSKAQELADKEGLEFVILSFDGFGEVERFLPQLEPTGRESRGVPSSDYLRALTEPQ